MLDKEIVEETIVEEYNLFEDGLSESDRTTLTQALELIKSTYVYKRYAYEDPDWWLCSAADGLEETLAGRWWQ